MRRLNVISRQTASLWHVGETPSHVGAGEDLATVFAVLSVDANTGKIACPCPFPGVKRTKEYT